MKPYLLLRASDLDRERPAGEDDNVHFTEALAASVIEDVTVVGDMVLDPFAGYGTTVAVAARLGRRAIGVELLADQVELASARVQSEVGEVGEVGEGAQIVQGDARGLRTVVHGQGLGDASVDLVLTSPPYMTSVAHPENPLTGYATDDGNYSTYLGELGAVFGQVAQLLRPGGQAVLNVANVVTHDAGGAQDVVTTLAWDIGRVVGQHLRFLGETFLCWDEHPPGLGGDYLLWFARD